MNVALLTIFLVVSGEINFKNVRHEFPIYLTLLYDDLLRRNNCYYTNIVITRIFTNLKRDPNHRKAWFPFNSQGRSR